MCPNQEVGDSTVRGEGTAWVKAGKGTSHGHHSGHENTLWVADRMDPPATKSSSSSPNRKRLKKSRRSKNGQADWLHNPQGPVQSESMVGLLFKRY